MQQDSSAVPTPQEFQIFAQTASQAINAYLNILMNFVTAMDAEPDIAQQKLDYTHQASMAYGIHLLIMVADLRERLEDLSETEGTINFYGFNLN